MDFCASAIAAYHMWCHRKHKWNRRLLQNGRCCLVENHSIVPPDCSQRIYSVCNAEVVTFQSVIVCKQ